MSDKLMHVGGEPIRRGHMKLISKIALTPEEGNKKIMQDWDVDYDQYSKLLDRVLSKELVKMVEDETKVWEVTDLGRLMLEKHINDLKYDLLYAKKKGDVSEDILDSIRRDKMVYERALKAVAGRQDYDTESQ